MAFFVPLKQFSVDSLMSHCQSYRQKNFQIIKMRVQARKIDCNRHRPSHLERFQSYANTASQVIGVAHSMYNVGKVVAPYLAAL